jgi:hypothetical protein
VSTLQMITWSNVDGKIPDGCYGRIHVFTAWADNPAEGTVCECEATVWTFTKCEHCGQNKGMAVDRRSK